MPLISVIIPVYNVEKELKRCIDSVLTQNFSDYEVIMVDDGSTDSSGAIAESYRSENIQVIHKPNGGLSSARSAGLERACGEYVWFIDSDDSVEPNSLQTIADCLRENDIDILCLGFKIYTAKGYTSQTPIYRERTYRGENLEAIRHHVFARSHSSLLTVWGHVYRRALIQDIPMISERLVYAEDIAFNILAYTKVESIYFSWDLCYRYIIRQGSLTYSGRTTLRPYLYAYGYLKQQLSLYGKWDAYAGDIAAAYFYGGILGEGKRGEGAIFGEYQKNPNLKDAHVVVRQALASREIAEMLQAAQAIQLSPPLAVLRNMVMSKDESALFRCMLPTLRELSAPGRVWEE